MVMATMAMAVVESMEKFWFWDNVIWPVSVPLATKSCSDDLDKESSELKIMVEEEQQRHQPVQQPPMGLFERRHRRSLSDDMRLDLGKLSTRKEGPSSLDLGAQANMQPWFIKETKYMSIPKVRKAPNLDTISSGKDFAGPAPQAPKLDTISSGKEFVEPAQTKMLPEVQQTEPRQRERKRSTKSLTDLEFDELKGFSELGFTFSKDDLTPRVVRILPGLQRIGKQETTWESTVSRPYLSEAWSVCRQDAPLLKWHMPAPHEEGVDMKEHLKFWAQAVASTVKMEC